MLGDEVCKTRMLLNTLLCFMKDRASWIKVDWMAEDTGVTHSVVLYNIHIVKRKVGTVDLDRND